MKNHNVYCKKFIPSCNWNNSYGNIISAIIDYLLILKLELLLANVQFIQLPQIPLPIVKLRLNFKICSSVNQPYLQVVASSAYCQLQCYRLKKTRQQMIALYKYKHKIPQIIILCTFNEQYFVFVRKIKFDLIPIEVIGHIFL